MTTVQAHPLADTATRDAIRNAGWQSSPDHPLQDNQTVRVDILSAQTHQTFSGFGGAVSELAWEALQHLSASDRDAFFTGIFARDGMGFDWVRLPVGSSDFALNAYSFCETPNDYELKSFSIERDRARMIPFIRAAKEANPGLRIHASPWSPPGWMKKSGRMDGPENGTMRDEPKVFRAYASYLRRFCEAYAEAGLPLERLMVQNEMDSVSAFPTCAWTPEQFVRFHLEYLKPEFEAHGVATEVWAGTFRTISGIQSHACFMNDEFRTFVNGAAFQYSAPDTIRELAGLYPGLRVMHTESVCHNGDNTPVQAAKQFDDVLQYLNAGVDVFSYWNLALNDEGKSSWGWRQNSMATVDRAATALIWNPDAEVYRLLGQAIRPGAVRVTSFSYLADTTCFRDAAGALTLLLWNLEDARMAEVTVDGKAQTVDLPARSLCAITL